LACRRPRTHLDARIAERCGSEKPLHCHEVPMSRYFVSGHLDLTQQEFDDHYAPRLLKALDAECSFVVGDARGCDRMTQEWLWVYNAFVTVYHMLEAPRNNVGFPTVGGFMSDAERDAAMTADSTRDVAWVREGRETSGTAKNLARRKA
jgi:hypothetical protein